MASEFGSPGYASGNAPPLSDKLSAAAREDKARAADLGRRAADSVDKMKESAADGLNSASDAVKDGVGLGQKQTRRSSRALSRGADYLRENDVSDMMEDAMDVVKGNPGIALLGAAAVGFLVGRALSSRS
jgi:ElaB/YqjD/DUF883 family membrane-anchored ribosome-binding protein